MESRWIILMGYHLKSLDLTPQITLSPFLINLNLSLGAERKIAIFISSWHTAENWQLPSLGGSKLIWKWISNCMSVNLFLWFEKGARYFFCFLLFWRASPLSLFFIYCHACYIWQKPIFLGYLRTWLDMYILLCIRKCAYSFVILLLIKLTSYYIISSLPGNE